MPDIALQLRLERGPVADLDREAVLRRRAVDVVMRLRPCRAVKSRRPLQILLGQVTDTPETPP
jgi:hypothetical protein